MVGLKVFTVLPRYYYLSDFWEFKKDFKVVVKAIIREEYLDFDNSCGSSEVTCNYFFMFWA